MTKHMRRVRVKVESNPHWLREKKTGWFGIKYMCTTEFVYDITYYEGYLHEIKTSVDSGMTGENYNIPYTDTTFKALVEADDGSFHEVDLKNITFIDKPV